jgi:coxsackievirus/adenovirus receptor
MSHFNISVTIRSCFHCRDELIGVDTNGFKFDGNGYLILDKGTNTNVKEYSKVQFDFKTFSEDGLMFLMGGDKGETDFFVVEMVGGKVKLIYNLGSGAGSVVSEQSFNDGKWHTLSAERYKKQGLLKVDGNTSKLLM